MRPVAVAATAGVDSPGPFVALDQTAWKGEPMKSLRLILVLACVGILAGVAQAQLASAILTEGQPLPGNPDYTVDSLQGAAVSGAAWGFNLNSLYQGDTVALVFGTYGVAMPDVLHMEIATDVYTQNSWESFWGLSDDGVCHSAICTRNADGATGLDSVWLMDTVVAIEEEVYPNEPGFWWSFGSRPSATRDGVPYFVGGITDEQGGSTDNRGLFYGFDNQVIIIGGMMIPGLPDPVVPGSAAVSFDYRYSAYGSHFIAEIATDTGSTANDNSMVYDGALLLIDGLPVTEGSPVPESIGGLPGENWDNFDYCGVTEDGQWMFTGDTDADAAVDEIVVISGMIALREGDVVDGLPLSGSIESGYMNEDGDWVVIWDVDLPDGTNVEAMIVNGEVVLMAGMPVDYDGDGVIDPDAVLDSFTGTASVALADRDAQGRALVYFTADCDIPGASPMGGDSQDRGDENGLEEPYVDEPGDRVVVELGLVYVPEGVVAIDEDNLPGDEAPELRLALDQNYPNPFNPQTTIQYHLERPGDVRVSIFDLQGRHVRTLVEGARDSGAHRVVWNGTDERGQAVPAGTYVYRLETEQRLLSRTMVLVK
jgi:hypothetical protein